MLLARVQEASRHFPRSQIGVSPQCGFASAIFGNPVSFEIEAAKLRRVGELAAAVAAGK
jgi:5-methyltetrahydropteroyltriglutamate--homocysteine methyltransferase